MEQPQPPVVASWLLRRLCDGKDEALIGDLLEKFRQGRSGAWFWRQALVAIAFRVLAELRLRWTRICHAIAGTAMCGFVGMRFVSRSPAMGQLWVWSRSLPWPWSSVVFDLSQAALLALAVLPILAALLLLNGAFRWASLLRAFGISFPLVAIGHLATYFWLLSHPAGDHPQSMMLNAVGVSRIFLALLVSAPRAPFASALRSTEGGVP